MLTISRQQQRYAPVVLSVLITMGVWLGSKWLYHDWFVDPFKYPAKAASLTATVLMCWCMLLSTRWRFLEDFFGGLDKVYQVHKHLGRWSFYIIVFHPLCLAADRLPHPLPFFADMWFRIPNGDHYLWGQNIGVAAFLGMTALITCTLWIKLAYNVWKRTHEWFGLVLILVAAHIITVDADIAAYPLLAVWMYALLGGALASFVYIRFLYRFLGPRFSYHVSKIVKVGDILELTFAPKDRCMDFRPSQFVYLVADKPGIPPESHPYSIACGYNLEAQFKLGIKQVGDHTGRLDLLEKGDQVTVYGPYGRFSDSFLAAKRDCVFIGGGIGITPFLGMWHVALHSEERVEEKDVPEELREMHPEIIRSWKSPRVALFYCVRHPFEASFDNDIRREVTLSHFHGFKALKQRGHIYELHVSARQGRITAEIIDQRLADGVQGRNIFLCGPTPMVDGLTRQFKALGVPDAQIIIEDFNLV